MNILVVLPIIIPMTTAAICLVAFRSRAAQRIISVVGALALFSVAVALLLTVAQDGILVYQLGNWAAPFGISLVADRLGALMVLLTGIIGLAVAVYGLVGIDRPSEAFGYHSLYHFLLMGVCGAFLTGDLFNLFVWFEVMLMASFVLIALGGERAQMAGALKYVVLNLMASALFLAGLGILYGMAGTLNMADLGVKFATLSSGSSRGLVTVLGMMFLVAFGIKSAVFPLFSWLPASYHTPPVTITALFSGLLTKVGAYAILRVFTLIFVQDAEFTHTLILIIAGFTMVTGVLGAVAQYDVRRLLSFHIISQIGYVMMGLGLFSPLALAGAVYFIVHVAVAKATLFLISGVMERVRGTFDLKKLGGFYIASPFLAVLFLVAALSLAGLPPLSGFFAKLSLVQAGLELNQGVIVGVALAVSILTLYSMIKIWNEAFWKPYTAQAGEVPAHPPLAARHRFALMAPIVFLAAVTVIMGFGVGPVFDYAMETGQQLANSSQYIQAVLGVTR